MSRGAGCHRSGAEQELDHRHRATLEVGRPIGIAGLDPLEHQPVEQCEEAAGDCVDIEPGRELAADHALAEQELAGAGEAFASAGQHLADPGFAVGLGPCLDEGHLPRGAVVLVDGLDVEPDGDRQPLGGCRGGGESRGELVEATRGNLVAGQADQLVLAREVRIDRPDGQAALADHVRDGRAVIALLGEDPARGVEDPLADLLLVGCADSRHVDS